MIPFIRQPQLQLGPLSFHAFGVLVVCAILVGATLLRRRAERAGLDGDEASRFVVWILVGGFLGAHLVDRLIYFPQQTLKDPLSLLRVWEGISSFGGFLGGTLAGLWFFRAHATSGSGWRHADAFAYAFPFGWVFGRLGCFLAFDHPGLPTDFILGQADRLGVVRHNLGLDEALYSLGVALLFAVLGRRRRFPGFFVGLFLLLYVPFRFLIDTLRTVDVRYLGLTPAQYGCLALLGVAAAILLTRHRPKAPPSCGA